MPGIRKSQLLYTSPLFTALLTVAFFQTQGASRIEIGQNFNATIAASGGTPATWTMAWIKDVSHDDVKMFGSKHGLKYVRVACALRSKLTSC